jgi:hypothetical protein
MQRTQGPSHLPPLIQTLRLLNGMVAIEPRPSANLRFKFSNAVKARLDHIDGRKFTRSEAVAQSDRPQTEYGLCLSAADHRRHPVG